MRAAAVLVVLAAACGEPASLGLDQPLRVRGATFRDGALPGASPDTSASGDVPRVTLVESTGQVVPLGDVSRKLSGRTSTDGAALGVALEGHGDGWWVLPLGPPDPVAGNELTWTVDASLAWDLPLGPANVLLVALDAAGHPGQQVRSALCIAPTVPDNASTCDATRAPPHTVVSLTWDRDVDLDLAVRTPTGKLVDHEHPSTIDQEEPITSADLRGEHVGILDRDSNRACAIDGLNRENLVWLTSPVPGPYLIYAGLDDACGAPAVRFVATIYQAQDQGDGTQRLVEIRRQEGQLTAAAADGGAGPGLFLMQLSL